MMEIADIFWALVVGLAGGGLVTYRFFPRTRTLVKEVPVEVVVTESASNVARFRLTWKRGEIRTNDMSLVSKKIEELRAAHQPYVYWMDGRLIHPQE